MSECFEKRRLAPSVRNLVREADEPTGLSTRRPRVLCIVTRGRCLPFNFTCARTLPNPCHRRHAGRPRTIHGRQAPPSGHPLRRRYGRDQCRMSENSTYAPVRTGRAGAETGETYRRRPSRDRVSVYRRGSSRPACPKQRGACDGTRSDSAAPTGRSSGFRPRK